MTSETQSQSSGRQRALMVALPPTTAHTACLLGSGQLHSKAGAVLDSHPHSTGISKMLVLTTTTGLHLQQKPPLVSLQDSDPATWSQASTSFHDSFNTRACPAVHIAPAASPGLPRCQASDASHDPFMPPKTALRG